MKLNHNAVSVPLLFCALLALLTCNSGNHTITYEVTGVAIEVSVLYNNEYGDAERFTPVKLPWVKTFDVQFRDDTYYGGKFVGDVFPALVSATLVDRRGHLSAVIYVNGEAVGTGATTANDYTATARYGVRLK
jgi:hypothetical protein